MPRCLRIPSIRSSCSGIDPASPTRLESGCPTLAAFLFLRLGWAAKETRAPSFRLFPVERVGNHEPQLETAEPTVIPWQSCSQTPVFSRRERTKIAQAETLGQGQKNPGVP